MATSAGLFFLSEAFEEVDVVAQADEPVDREQQRDHGETENGCPDDLDYEAKVDPFATEQVRLIEKAFAGGDRARRSTIDG